MPCRDWDDDCSPVRSIPAGSAIHKRLVKSEKKLDAVTDFLCYTLKYLKTNHPILNNDLLDSSRGLREWAKEHAIMDEKRLKAEAMAKLNDTDKRALGLI